MAVLSILFTALVVLFSFEYTQTKTAQYLVKRLHNDYGINADIKSVYLSFRGNFVLKGLKINDHHNNTLLEIATLKTGLTSLGGIFYNQILLSNIEIDRLQFLLTNYAGEDDDNLEVFLNALSTESSSSSSDFLLMTKRIRIYDSHFVYTDYNFEQPEIMGVYNFNTDIEYLKIFNDDIEIPIQKLSFFSGRCLDVQSLSGLFKMKSGLISVENARIETKRSSIDLDFFMAYESGAFKDFNNQVLLTANFRNSIINTTDINNYFEAFQDGYELTIDGKLSGPLNNLYSERLVLTEGSTTNFDGNLRIENILSDEPIKLQSNFERLSANITNLSAIMPSFVGNYIPKQIIKLGTVDLVGSFGMNDDNYTIDVEGKSTLGFVKTKTTFTDLNSNLPKYVGNLKLRDFNMGNFLDEPKLGKVFLDIDVDGKGFDAVNFDALAKGKISSLTYNAYNYQNIEMNGRFKYPFFAGIVKANDPNFNLDFNGLIKAEDDYYDLNFYTNVRKLDLYQLKFIERDSIANLTGEISINLKGKNFDDFVGKIDIVNGKYQIPNQQYIFNDFSINSEINDGVKTISIDSPDIIEGEIIGAYKIERLPALFQNALASVYSNYKPVEVTENDFIEFDLEIHNKIVELFVPEIKLSENTRIKGNISSQDATFILNINSPEITAYGIDFEELELKVNNTNPLFNTYISLKSIKNAGYDVQDFRLINVTLQDTLFLRSQFSGGKRGNDKFAMNMYHTINENNNSVFGFKKSSIRFNEYDWILNPENNISELEFDNNFNDFYLDELSLENENQRMNFQAVVLDSTYKDIKVDFRSVEIAKILPEIDSLSIEGVIDGRVKILQEDSKYAPIANIYIDNLNVNQYDLGDLDLNIEGDDSFKDYSIDAVLSNPNITPLDLRGMVYTDDELNAKLDLSFESQGLQIGIFEPLLVDVFDKMRGELFARGRIEGDFNNPIIYGDIELKNSGLRVPYLNVDFQIDEPAKIDIQKDRFVFNNLKLTDTEFNTDARLNGSINHKNLKDWSLDLNLQTDRMLALNTTQNEESLYYGTAFMNGSVNFSGPFDNIFIDIKAKTLAGTNFVIPLSNNEYLGDDSMIRFLSPEEKAAILSGETIEENRISNLELNFDLEVTPDATVEIKIDPETGSYLKGSGGGNLNLSINTAGKFNMFGEYTVERGVFDYKYSRLIERDFEVEKGGTIVWDGDPLGAILNLRAIYETQANPAMLLENPGSSNRKIPVRVITSLNGPMTYFDPEFEIEFPQASSVVSSELQFRLQDKTNRELQALSLIATGSFFNAANMGNNAFNNLASSTISNMVNNLFGNQNSKFNIGLDFQAGERTPEVQTADQFGINISSQITDRIIVNSKIGVPVGGSNTQQNQVIGDIEVDFLLNESGTFQFQIFNRQNPIQVLGQINEGSTQGLGLNYSVDFDNFNELIQKIFKPKAAKAQPESAEDSSELVKFKK